jgi:hypothetical protein
LTDFVCLYNTVTVFKYRNTIKSRMFIPVNIQSSEHLADLGLVDEISKQGRDGEFYITRGILESHNTAAVVDSHLHHTMYILHAAILNLSFCASSV